MVWPTVNTNPEKKIVHRKRSLYERSEGFAFAFETQLFVNKKHDNHASTQKHFYDLLLPVIVDGNLRFRTNFSGVV